MMPRRRCVTPDGRPGSWHAGLRPTWDAMHEALWMADRRAGLDDATVAQLWQSGLKGKGWRLETERPQE